MSSRVRGSSDMYTVTRHLDPTKLADFSLRLPLAGDPPVGQHGQAITNVKRDHLAGGVDQTWGAPVKPDERIPERNDPSTNGQHPWGALHDIRTRHLSTEFGDADQGVVSCNRFAPRCAKVPGIVTPNP